jgi:multidrug efflux pump subunit AcrA (membrane-fusion protein)
VLAFLLSPIALLGMRKRRAVATRFLALLLVVGLGALSGCGGSGPSGTTTHTASPGTYNVTIIGTAADGTTTATTALAVTVK